jgi:putative membrane protein
MKAMTTLARGLVTGAFLAPSVAGRALADAAGGEHGHEMMGGWGPMILGPLMMLLVVVAIVVLVVLVVRWLGGAGAHPAPQAAPAKTPLDILKERFARGEIDQEDFEARRRTLES